MERKTKGLALLSVILVAVIASGILVLTQASNAAAAVTNLQGNYNTQLAVLTTAASDATNLTSTIPEDGIGMSPGWGRGLMGFGRNGGCGMGGFGQIQVSDEYKTAVTTIADNDSDVQSLLASGYNVTNVMPIVTTTIGADGTLTTKAANATVILEKDTTGVAFVSVDLSQSKVTQIVTYTKTVIEK